MKRVFIGHRGVGKTELLKRHQAYFSNELHFDLDQEIEKSQQKKISEIFNSEGEAAFRIIELKIFNELVKNKNFVISLGAGFEVEKISENIEVIYVSRRTDFEGRLFLNRPRLNSDMTAIEEYIERFKHREPFFRSRADFIYHLPEGLVSKNLIEQQIFNQDYKLTDAYVTATNLKLNKNLDQKIFEKINIELRTDIFSTADIQKIISVKKNNFLISYRKKSDLYFFKTGPVDWALELGAPPEELKSSQLIVSNHDDPIQIAIEKFKTYAEFRQKLCPIITNWKDLELGHAWQSEDPAQRSFLPRTPANEKKSKWRWYRQLQFLKQKINFIQGSQDFDDQPSLFEYLNLKIQTEFAAVLGEPVHHSKTPITQGQNFKLNVLAIPVAEEEFEIAISILKNMGLVAAAVTSPLKNKAAQLCGKTEAVNSLVLKNNLWVGTSTDEFGLEKLIEQISDYKSMTFAVWGGGGVLNSIRKILPTAIFYSAQTQQPRDVVQTKRDSTQIQKENIKIKNPDVIIWAAPRKPEIQMPPKDWQPQYIIDLNYTENSMGLEYVQLQNAQLKNIKYISGDKMFYAQAEKQLQFWIDNLD